MKRMKNIGGVDRISELPECIILQIMSRLSAKEVVRTSVLSKTWYGFKASYPPVLNFKQDRYREEPVSKFTQLVYNSLHHIGLNKLGLRAFIVALFNTTLPSDLDCWISLALENGVEELDIFPPTIRYTLPQPVFFSKTLTILNLEFCILDQPLSLFSSLRKLDFKYCHFKVPIILKNGDCPLLEEFIVYGCEYFDSVLHICNLPQLHTVVFNMVVARFMVEFVVSCQNIQSITIRDKVELLSVINIDGCNRVKFLYLLCDNMTDTQFHRLLSKLSLLEELYVFHCYTLKAIKISNPRLKTLVVSLIYKTSLEIVEIAAPSLKSFIFASDLFKPNSCRIKVADCCCSLETLVLFKYFATERAIHNLISKFPLLENLWILGFPKLQRIRVPNLQLRRLHFVRCLKLKAMKVDSPNLCEFSYTGREMPKFAVADMKASGSFKFEHETSKFWSNTFLKMLADIVGNENRDLISMIYTSVCEHPY
ncbi:hypothetical protein SLA2020_515680 [Shorea laevis]